MKFDNLTRGARLSFPACASWKKGLRNTAARTHLANQEGIFEVCQEWSVKDIRGIADELTELRRLEKEKGIQPDPEIDAFMKANAIEGKRESIETEYVLHILGLGVCADTLVGCLPKSYFFVLCVKMYVTFGRRLRLQGSKQEPATFMCAIIAPSSV